MPIRLHLAVAISMASIFVPAHADDQRIAQAQSVDSLREQAVLQIRQGQVEQGLTQLKTLLAQHPTQQKLIADYLMLAYQHQQLSADDLQYIQKIDAASYPQYAYMTTLSALRDQKQFPQAITLAQQFSKQQPSTALSLMHGVLLAENAQPEEALTQLDQLNEAQLNTSQRLQLAYAYRISGNLVKSLTLTEQAYQAEPDNQEAINQYIATLNALGSVEKAQQVAEQHGLADRNNALSYQTKQRYFADQIKQALQVRDYRMAWLEPNINEKLDQVIVEMQDYATQIDQKDPMYKAFNYDLIYVLSERRRSQQAIDLYRQLGYEQQQIPAYVEQAVADAYLNARQPKQAEPLYKHVIAQSEAVDFSAYSGLYYALIEQEKFKEAEQMLEKLDQILPKKQYSDAAGVNADVHPDRSAYINLYGLHQAYSNRLAVAEKYFQDLLAVAPNNESYITQLAMIQRWRNKPLQAEQTLARLNAIEPVSKSRQLNAMQNAQALGNVPAWRTGLEKLEQLDPDDTGVIKARQELDDRDRFAISHQTSFGESKADNASEARSLQGLSDRDSTTTLYTPWFKDNFRAYAEYRNRWGEFRDGEIEENRYGVGLEWTVNRKSLSGLVSQSESGDRAGVDLQWSHWLNDHWNYGLGVNTAADIPMQALVDDHNGQSYQANLTWQKDESRRVNVGYQFTDIDDGNQRQELSASFNQDLWNSAHHRTEGTVYAYYGKNSLDNADYFNPDHHHSLELNVRHDWMTWRNYEKSLNQVFEAAVGYYAQADYDTLPTYVVQYSHEWDLSRTWQLRYGVGWKQHPYDGEQEQRTFGMVGLEGRF
ncbi:poly-beta-1,6 N-acetyl-D-glucosamine export porin PgaA [Acinetobacter marinus]|uniref:Poly-beta-1,6 N-acetyl-D-glucosamine export porin PgaA n=1 Tax=Acinetobacter marinus TaxID=281375 RepID=A0A1G6GY51_9GAMM|nr:poly-beta-1,6 N-acetyl-D-glucosamine export porin PgaA [Acinetobacter marinus]SDB86843.1 poly-beta-1,6 N-acetyl-D-glucosamine export porin PgaA [Acinetobacter marinus]